MSQSQFLVTLFRFVVSPLFMPARICDSMTCYWLCAPLLLSPVCTLPDAAMLNAGIAPMQELLISCLLTTAVGAPPTSRCP